VSRPASLSRSVFPLGFSLVEMIVVLFLLVLTLLGILSVLDASARINKSEQDVADAQGAVRYGVFTMTRTIRMAGSGGLPVTQAVLNVADKDLPGFKPAATAISFDNVGRGTKVVSTNGDVLVRPGTDMLEIRGVINSPLVGFDLSSGCEPCTASGGCSFCTGNPNLTAVRETSLGHVNDDPTNRPQFSQVDAYTAGVSATDSMLVLVAFNTDSHPNCTQPTAAGEAPLYPQPFSNVGVITAKTTLAGSGHTFGAVNFDDARSREFNAELPSDSGVVARAMKDVRHAGILDDIVFFVDNTDPLHPALAQGIRRGDRFDVAALADDIEDMQIAYGVDLDDNNSINRRTGARSFDENVSSDADGDEWVPNVVGETPMTATDFRTANLCPRLHSVMISLVAKSHDPDPTYRAPAARGFLTMNSPASGPRDYPGLTVTSFRRRIQTLKINLRNYAYEGS
jgi:type II secretory pathway pseudopilin PulG